MCDPCYLVCKKGQKVEKSKYVTKSVGMIVTIISNYFHVKMLVKPFLHSFFFIDQWSHKTVKKTTCRMHSANPGQLWAHLLKNFWIAVIIWGF